MLNTVKLKWDFSSFFLSNLLREKKQQISIC